MEKPDLSLPPKPPTPDYLTTCRKELAFASIWGKTEPAHAYLANSILNSTLVLGDEQDNIATHRRAGTWDSPRFAEVFNMSDARKRSNPGSDVTDLAESVAKGMRLDIDEQGSSGGRGRSQSFPLYSPHSFMNNSSPLPPVRTLHDHAEEGPNCDTLLPARLTPGAEYSKVTKNLSSTSHKRVVSNDSIGWMDPWDRPINPVYDPITGKLIGTDDVPRKVPYWVTDGESSEESIPKKDNDSWSFMTCSNTHSDSHSDTGTESLGAWRIPKSFGGAGERAKDATKLPIPSTHNLPGYVPPELRNEYRNRNRGNELHSKFNRSHEIIDGTHQRTSQPQISRDAAAPQHENWHTGEAGFENRIDNRETLSTKAAYRIDAMDRKGTTTTTEWPQSSTSRMWPVSQDARSYAWSSSPMSSKYYTPDVPTRYVTPSQEHISDSLCLPAKYAYQGQRGFTPQYYSSSESLASLRSVKPMCGTNMIYHPIPSGPQQTSPKNPAYSSRGAASSAYHIIGGKPIPSSIAYKPGALSGGNTATSGNGRDISEAGNAANIPNSTGHYYRTIYERTSPRPLRRSANRENLRGLPMRTC